MDKILEKLKGTLTEEDLASLKEAITETANQKATLLSESLILEAKNKFDKDLDDEKKKLKEESETATTAGLKEIEEHLVEELDRFLETQITDKIDESLLDDIAINKACQPIVDGILSLFEEKYVKLDTEGYNLLKEAADEIESKSAELTEAIEEKLSLVKEIEGLKKASLISESVSKLNEEQKVKVTTFFADKSLNETETKVAEFVSMLVEAAETIEKVPSNKNLDILNESGRETGDFVEPIKTVNPMMKQLDQFLP